MDRLHRHVLASRARRLVASVVLATALAGCGDDAPERSETAYCTAVGDHLAELNTTSFVDAVEVERVLAVWRTVGQTAPLAVEPEWRTVIAAMDTAAAVSPSDAASLQQAADVLRRSQPAADRLIDYTFRLCNAVIGPTAPVVTTPLQLPPSGPSTSTTAP